MLMEYLGPVVDGCRAALNVSIEKAEDLRKMSEDDFEDHCEFPCAGQWEYGSMSEMKDRLKTILEREGEW